MRFRGQYLTPHASALRELGEQVVATQGRVFLLADVADGLMPGPQDHRFVAEQTGKLPASGVAYFGSSLTGRAVGILLESAIRLYRGRRVPTLYASDETRARAWIDDRRRALLSSPAR